MVLCVNHSVAELAQGIEYIDKIIIWENKKHAINEILSFSRTLKNLKFDLCVIFNPSGEFNIISFLAKIPVRLGYNRKNGFLLTHKIKDKKHLAEKHEIEYNLELLNAIGAQIEDKTLSLNISNAIIERAVKDFHLENLTRLIALHPWTSDSIKQWPVNNFLSLAKKITGELNAHVVLIGGREEKSKSIELFGAMNNRVVNITGSTTLPQLAAIFKKCELLISGDSGPVHLAGAVNTKVLAIFRNDIVGKNSKRWGPWGEGHTVIEKNSLSEISVDQVFAVVKHILNKSNNT